jgi:hypothetical protein
MGELAAHLVDGVLGGLPVRQWALRLPFRLRYRLAYDHRLCRAVPGVFVRTLLGFEQRRGVFEEHPESDFVTTLNGRGRTKSLSS